MTQAAEGFPEESKDSPNPDLGSLRIAFQPKTSRKKICLWNSPDDDDLVEFDCEISCDSLLIVVEVRGEYYRVLTENCLMGWIHKRNTEDL